MGRSAERTLGNGFATVTEIANAQDIANIAAGLDWRLNSAQAAQVFNELSSAEIYGSLAAVDQNAVFNTTVNRLAARRSYGEALGTQLWFNPSANFAKTGGTKSGASKIKTNSYGGAFGIDVAYQEDGAFGIGFGYGQHDVTAQGSPEEAQVRTYTIGAYATQGFGPFYGSFQFAYGFSKFEVERDLTLLARTIKGDFKGKQLDASIELGYDFSAGGSLVVTPYGKLALRRWSMNGFTEEGGAGIGLRVEDASKTVFSPVLGVKAGALLGDADGIAYRPYAKVQYSFQGNIGSDRTVQYLGGGDAFRLKGVDPDGNGLIELGVDASVNKRVNLFLSGGYGFGGHNSIGQVRGGISFGF
ncbi:autotransporter outer membrane beta-barrel domain-containing protein [Sphingobium sp. SJ10-10]|uniref:autotransporter outer membrane beta-barrel domain-containing protein n=1 Tax=Sphingobium sp. SJ10-10 TaxID=3114999 RepID=UPI002E18C91A|nr:autotransporter outer membrane beta-barrel domain-containing protein [Sphingobium sp. SJ10-10]